MTALHSVAWISMMLSSILADDPHNRFDPACTAQPPACWFRLPGDRQGVPLSPSEVSSKKKTIKHHFEVWGSEQSLHRLNQQSCSVAIYQVSNFDGKSSVEGGLAYLAHENRDHHLFDGVLNVPVDQYKLKNPEIGDYDAILEGYLDNHFCDEAHLYINLPNKGEFEKVEDAIKEAKEAIKEATKENKPQATAKAAEAAKKATLDYFHTKQIYQNALPAVLRNIGIKKLVVHRVVGFTHASFGDLAEDPKRSIDKSDIYNEDLSHILKKVHTMDPVEFDLDEYRKDKKIQICETDTKHEACFTADSEWHPVTFKSTGGIKQFLPYRTNGLVHFIDSMFLSVAEEYQNVLQSPNTGKGVESFKSIWTESQKKSKSSSYITHVQGNKKSPYSIDKDLTHVAAQEEWPTVMSSVAKTVQENMRSDNSASDYEKYVVGSDVSRLLPLLALGIPFLMYR
jgi:hypothetical protein